MGLWIMLFLLLVAKAPDDQLARSGSIQENAPVKAAVELTINAPPEKVWNLLTDVSNWPKWQADITQADIKGPLQSGTDFVWSTGDSSIHSRIALCSPHQQFAWTGKAYWLKAVHRPKSLKSQTSAG